MLQRGPLEIVGDLPYLSFFLPSVSGEGSGPGLVKKSLNGRSLFFSFSIGGFLVPGVTR